MDLRTLGHFHAIATHRNLRRAAEALGVTQPALSQSVRRLEAELQVRLLERGQFGVAPTPIGAALAAHAALILADLDRARAEIDALRGARAGEVVMGAGPSEATRLLPLALLKLRARSPDIAISVHHGLNEQLMPAVRRGEIEFALSSIPRAPQSDDLCHEPIWRDSAAVVVRAGHPLCRKRRLGLADLLDYPWIHSRRPEFERRVAEELFLSRGLPAPRMAVETTSATLIKAMVAESDYVTFIPREFIHFEERAGILAALSIGSKFWKRTVGVTYRRNGRLMPATRALIAEIKAVGALLAEDHAGPSNRHRSPAGRPGAAGRRAS